jgi:hypothetical protein
VTRRTLPDPVGELRYYLAIAKQHLATIERFAPVARILDTPELALTDSQWRAIDDAAIRLGIAMDAISDLFTQLMVRGDSIIEIEQESVRFYRERLEPIRHHVQNIEFRDLKVESPDEWLPRKEQRAAAEDSVEFTRLRQGNLEVVFAYAIRELLNEMECGNPSYERLLEGGFGDLDRLRREADWVIASGLLRPDDWISNADELSPVLTETPARNIPTNIRARLSEISRLFTLGQWMGCIALSRALLEYVLLHRASRFSQDVYESRRSKRKPKRLREIVEIAGVDFPQLAGAMEEIIDLGNTVMHPKTGGKMIQLEPERGRAWAKRAVTALRRVCEVLFANSGS